MHLASLYGHTLSVKTKKRTNLGLNLDIRYICLDLNLGSVFFFEGNMHDAYTCYELDQSMHGRPIVLWCHHHAPICIVSELVQNTKLPDHWSQTLSPCLGRGALVFSISTF